MDMHFHGRFVDTTGRQGSVSVTDRGHSATVSTHRLIRESVVQSVFLGRHSVHKNAFSGSLRSKSYDTDLPQTNADPLGEGCENREGPSRQENRRPIAFFIHRVSPERQLADIAFGTTDRIQQGWNRNVETVYGGVKINHKAMTEQEAAWQNEFRDTITRRSSTIGDSTIGYNAQFNRLAQELQQMKEDFASRNIGETSARE